MILLCIYIYIIFTVYIERFYRCMLYYLHMLYCILPNTYHIYICIMHTRGIYIYIQISYIIYITFHMYVCVCEYPQILWKCRKLTFHRISRLPGPRAGLPGASPFSAERFAACRAFRGGPEQRPAAVPRGCRAQDCCRYWGTPIAGWFVRENPIKIG